MIHCSFYTSCFLSCLTYEKKISAILGKTSDCLRNKSSPLAPFLIWNDNINCKKRKKKRYQRFMLQPNFTWHIYSASDIVFCIALWTRNFLPECSSKFLLCYFLDIPERRPILQSCVNVYHDGCNSSGPYGLLQILDQRKLKWVEILVTVKQPGLYRLVVLKIFKDSQISIAIGALCCQDYRLSWNLPQFAAIVFLEIFWYIEISFHL